VSFSNSQNSSWTPKGVFSISNVRVIFWFGLKLMDYPIEPVFVSLRIGRLGLPRIIRLKENAPELDYSPFYGKTGWKTNRFVIEVEHSS
jgi:hypothetical protein